MNDWESQEAIVADRKVQDMHSQAAAEQDAENSRVWGVWYGGASYSIPEGITSLEYFQDITEAKGALLDRYSHGDWQEQVFNYADGRSESVRTPSVNEDSVILIYLSNPVDRFDTYPDRELSLTFNSDDEVVVVDGEV